jgi:hypothetical protein
LHPCLCPKAIGGLFSVALSVGLLRPAVSRHPALWSPDFPQVETRGRPANSREKRTPVEGIEERALFFVAEDGGRNGPAFDLAGEEMVVFHLDAAAFWLAAD